MAAQPSESAQRSGSTDRFQGFTQAAASGLRAPDWGLLQQPPQENPALPGKHRHSTKDTIPTVSSVASGEIDPSISFSSAQNSATLTWDCWAPSLNELAYKEGDEEEEESDGQFTPRSRCTDPNDYADYNAYESSGLACEDDAWALGNNEACTEGDGAEPTPRRSVDSGDAAASSGCGGSSSCRGIPPRASAAYAQGVLMRVLAAGAEPVQPTALTEAGLDDGAATRAAGM